MIKIQENILENSTFCNFSDKDLKSNFFELKTQSLKDVQERVILILIEKIKRIYDYIFSVDDIKYLNHFINNISLDISNSKAYFSFLIYTILCDIQKIQLHCLFSDDFSARKYFEKSAKLYTDFNIGASYNTNTNINKQIKDKIYSNNIIFSNWKRVAFDKIDNLNIEKMADKFAIKFNQAFIFDIDRIIYDYEKLILKIQDPKLNITKIKARTFFEGYKNIVGISSSLFFENNKIKKSYKIKTNLQTNSKEIIKKLKNCNDYFYSTRDEKIRNLSKQITSLQKEKQTAIIDIDNQKDFQLLKEYLELKKINYTLVSTTSNLNNALEILTPNKITIMTDLLSANFESKLGGNYEDIAKKNTLAYNNDTTSNFYKEKYKKELATQKEISKQNKDELIKQGGITILFASHYTELKFEYLILKNYINIPIKSIQFYNCPEDEIFKDFKLDNLNIFNKEKTSENQLLFKLFSKFLFFIRSFSINHLLKQQKGYLFYTVNQEQKAKGQYISQEKPKRNDPCPCGSGLKYKNCCGKQQ